MLPPVAMGPFICQLAISRVALRTYPVKIEGDETLVDLHHRLWDGGKVAIGH
jgi:hypothetical protein